MNRGDLWKITVATAPETEEAVGALLERVFGEPAVTFTDPERDRTEVSVFLPQRADWNLKLRRALEDGLVQLQRPGRPSGSGRIAARRIPREDWAESWKKHFRPLVIGRRLLLKPSWSARQPQPGQAVVVLDPGLSFGTGQHPTTRFCLAQLTAFRHRRSRPSFLDVGTGSGILAIAAAKLGYAPVQAVECDPEALRIARRNAAQNQVQRLLRLRRLEVAQLSSRPVRRFDLVCANLTSDLLLAHRQHLVTQLSGNGRLVLAGILERQFAEVHRAYRQSGMRLVARRIVGEWESGAFEYLPDCPHPGQPAQNETGRTKRREKIL